MESRELLLFSIVRPVSRKALQLNFAAWDKPAAGTKNESGGVKMQNEYEIKKEICDIGKRIYNRNMVAANDGNISVKLSDNEFLCTPTGVSKGFMTPEYICKVDAQGNVIQANGNFKPSSEIKMHMRVYQERPDVRSVVHAHPVYATSFAIAGIV